MLIQEYSGTKKVLSNKYFQIIILISFLSLNQLGKNSIIFYFKWEIKLSRCVILLPFCEKILFIFVEFLNNI